MTAPSRINAAATTAVPVDASDEIPVLLSTGPLVGLLVGFVVTVADDDEDGVLVGAAAATDSGIVTTVLVGAAVTTSE